MLESDVSFFNLFSTFYELWQRFQSVPVASIGSSVDYSSYAFVQWILVWRDREPYVWGEVIVEILIHSFLCYLVRRKRYRGLLVGLSFFTLSLQSLANLSNTSLQSASFNFNPCEKKCEGMMSLLLSITLRTTTVAGRFVYMIVGTTLGFLHNCQSFVLLFDPDLKFSHRSETKLLDS